MKKAAVTLMTVFVLLNVTSAFADNNSDIELTLIPHATVLSPGELVEYTLIITNNTDSPYHFKYVEAAQLIYGEPVMQKIYRVHDPLFMVVEAGSVFSKVIVRYVPENAKPGDYLFSGRLMRTRGETEMADFLFTIAE